MEETAVNSSGPSRIPRPVVMEPKILAQPLLIVSDNLDNVSVISSASTMDGDFKMPGIPTSSARKRPPRGSAHETQDYE